MKILLAVLAFCYIVVVAHCDRTLSASNSDMETCSVRNKIDKITLIELKRNRTFSATPDTQCFAGCVLKEIGIMADDGTVNKDFIDSDIASRCKNYFFAFGKDQCEIAAKILQCLTQKRVLILPDE